MYDKDKPAHFMPSLEKYDIVMLRQLEAKVMENIPDNAMCCIRNCHSAVWEFGLCQEHFMLWEPLYKELFAFTGVLTIKIEPPHVQTDAHWHMPNYRKTKSRARKSERRKPTSPPVPEFNLAAFEAKRAAWKARAK